MSSTRLPSTGPRSRSNEGHSITSLNSRPRDDLREARKGAFVVVGRYPLGVSPHVVRPGSAAAGRPGRRLVGQLERFEDLALAVGEFGALGDGAFVGREGDEVHAVEFVA